MHGHQSYDADALAPDFFHVTCSWQCVGTAVGALDRAAQLFRAPMGMPGPFAVSYAATGIYTFTAPAGVILPAQPLIVRATPQAATLATDWFDCLVIGETTLTSTTKQIVVQCHRNGTAQAPANTAGNRINLTFAFSNNTGR